MRSAFSAFSEQVASWCGKESTRSKRRQGHCTLGASRGTRLFRAMPVIVLIAFCKSVKAEGSGKMGDNIEKKGDWLYEILVGASAFLALLVLVVACSWFRKLSSTVTGWFRRAGRAGEAPPQKGGYIEVDKLPQDPNAIHFVPASNPAYKTLVGVDQDDFTSGLDTGNAAREESAAGADMSLGAATSAEKMNAPSFELSECPPFEGQAVLGNANRVTIKGKVPQFCFIDIGESK